MGYNMNGFSGFGNSPVKKKLTAEQMKERGITTPGAKDVDPFSDDERAYENAQNDYNTENPTEAQIAASKKEILKERKE